MPLDAASVGATFETAPKRVELASALAFAAGLGAMEGAFLDDHTSSPFPCLPFYCVSLEWQAVLGLRRVTASMLTPDEAARAVHAGQSSRFLLPIVAGMLVVTQARLAAARLARPGTICTYQIDTRCAHTGELLTATRSTTIFRDVALSGDVAPVPDPAANGAPWTLGEGWTEIGIPIARSAPHVYSACANIWNPIHTERAVALAAGLPDIILHGTATWALAGLEIVRERLGGDASRLRGLSGDFAGMVIPGAPLRLRLGKPDASRLPFEVRGPSGDVVLRKGVAFVEAS